MSYPVIFLDEVKLRNDARVLRKLFLPHLEQLFNDVLAPLINFTLLKYVSESLENGIDSCWRDLV